MPRRARNSSPASELKLLLERLLSDDNYMQAEKLINAMCGTAQDEPSDFTGKPTTGASNSRIAMDASSAGGQYQAIRAALALVEPHVGQIATDSAAAVLREGLSRLSIAQPATCTPAPWKRCSGPLSAVAGRMRVPTQATSQTAAPWRRNQRPLIHPRIS